MGCDSAIIVDLGVRSPQQQAERRRRTKTALVKLAQRDTDIELFLSLQFWVLTTLVLGEQH